MPWLRVLWCGLFWVYWLIVAPPAGATEAYGLDHYSGSQPYLSATIPHSPPTKSLEWTCIPAFPNLKFTNALGLTFVPGTSNLVVWEREGRIYSFPNSAPTTEMRLILDIHDHCQGWDDSGLLGVAFHPGFATNHWLFVYYTWVSPGTVVGNPTSRPPEFKAGAYLDRLSKFATDDTGSALNSQEVVLVDQVGDSAWHNGGGLFFHPHDGFLYYSDGDDRRGPTQVVDKDLFSGVFRLDVDQRGGNVSHPIPRQPNHGRTANYFIPNDNPFVGRPGVLEEYFALGLRNPYRMTIDTASRRIYIGDVGMDQREEIDVIEPGDRHGVNFQWNLAEGRGTMLKSPFPGADRPPLYDYDHGEGQAVVGGYVYRGRQFEKQLGGKYVFGDNVQRKIWVLDQSQQPPRKILLCTLPEGDGPNSGSNYRGLSSFGLDADNELFVCQMSSVGGLIYRLANKPQPTPVFQDFPPLLSQTGAFDDTARLQPAPGLLPYDVISPLWSDGATKQRWIAVPTGLRINITNDGWRFPAGTVFIKHFELPASASEGTSARRLETRFLVVADNGAAFGATYRWRKDNSDAELLDDMVDEAISAGGTTPGTRSWHYPSRTECSLCHNPGANEILGIKATQLNRDFKYPQTGVTDNQLRTWNHVGILSPSLDEAEISKMTKLTRPDDSGARLESRVRSYLDANCSQCHHSNSGAWDARISTPIDKANIINGAVSLNLGLDDAKMVVPGHPERSVLLYRLQGTGVSKMPPLAKNSADEAATGLVREWIQSLPGGEK